MRKKQPVIYIIGLDVSRNNTGVSIQSINKKKPLINVFTVPANQINAQVKASNAKNKIEQYYIHFLIHKIIQNILNITKQTDMKNCFIVMEDYAYSAKGKTFVLGEIGGHLKQTMLFTMDLPPENLIICTTQRLKMFVCGAGNAKKELMLKEVFRKYNFDTTSNDKADAFGLMQIGAAIKGLHPKITTYQKDVLKKIMESNRD